MNCRLQIFNCIVQCQLDISVCSEMYFVTLVVFVHVVYFSHQKICVKNVSCAVSVMCPVFI